MRGAERSRSNKLVRWVKQKEDTDVFDQDIDYNPFKFK